MQKANAVLQLKLPYFDIILVNNVFMVI